MPIQKNIKPLDRKCPICDGPVENIPNPHFHVINGKIVNSRDAWEKVYQQWLNANLWSL